MLEDEVSESGYIKLEWSGDTESIYVLERALSADFSDATVIYEGPDKASFVSGLENGTYHFRVKSIHGPWSPTLVIEVEHQSLKLAISLFIIGAIVFMLTVMVILRGMRKVQVENTK